MDKIKLHAMINNLKEENRPSYFSLKKIGEHPEYFIDANRNGVLSFCEILLESLEKSDIEDKFQSDMPDNYFGDDSDAWINYITVDNGDRKPIVKHRVSTFFEQVGCFSVLIAGVIIFVVGVVSTVSWLINVLG